MKLTRHFGLKHFTACAVAEQENIPNDIPGEYVANLLSLCEHVLEPLHHHFHKKINIVCGFLSPELNARCHGTGESQHLYGEAVDILITNQEKGLEWFYWIRDHCEFDQLIWEHKRDGSSCIHVSCKVATYLHRHTVLRTPLVKKPARRKKKK